MVNHFDDERFAIGGRVCQYMIAGTFPLQLRAVDVPLRKGLRNGLPPVWSCGDKWGERERQGIALVTCAGHQERHGRCARHCLERKTCRVKHETGQRAACGGAALVG